MGNPNEKPDPLHKVQITRLTLSCQVAEQIQSIIVDGQMMPGDRLPPERELAERLSVSRNVIREATKVLQDRGLVRINPGSGTYVSNISAEAVTHAMSLYLRAGKAAIRNLLEVRALLETQIAALAARRADETDIELLELASREMEENLVQARLAQTEEDRSAALERYADGNVFFHETLARACKNNLLPLVLQPVMQLMLESGWRLAMQTGGAEKSPAMHRKIIDCIRRRDEQGCQDAMREDIHLSASGWAELERDAGLNELPLQ
jgi:GntR family transcriptional repressor for pyruvate dehydrogenase complex